MPPGAHPRAFLRPSTALGPSPVRYRRGTGANDRVGVGVIGYGLIGKRHVGTFASMKGADLVAVAEVCRGRREEGLKAAGKAAVGYEDFRKLLDAKEVQAVVVATPDHWHALMTM